MAQRIVETYKGHDIIKTGKKSFWYHVQFQSHEFAVGKAVYRSKSKTELKKFIDAHIFANILWQKEYAKTQKQI